MSDWDWVCENCGFAGNQSDACSHASVCSGKATPREIEVRVEGRVVARVVAFIRAKERELREASTIARISDKSEPFAAARQPNPLWHKAIQCRDLADAIEAGALNQNDTDERNEG